MMTISQLMSEKAELLARKEKLGNEITELELQAQMMLELVALKNDIAQLEQQHNAIVVEHTTLERELARM